MIEAKRNFTQVEVGESFGQPVIGVEPVLSMMPETLDRADMGACCRMTNVSANDDPIPVDCQRGIGMPVIRVVEIARSCVFTNQADELGVALALHSGDTNHAIVLADAEDENPAALSLTTLE